MVIRSNGPVKSSLLRQSLNSFQIVSLPTKKRFPLLLTLPVKQLQSAFEGRRRFNHRWFLGNQPGERAQGARETEVVERGTEN